MFIKREKIEENEGRTSDEIRNGGFPLNESA